jgi:hypothetical protein
MDSGSSLLSTWPGLAMQIWCYIVNFIIIIIMLNLSVFFFYVWNGMLCTKYIIVFSLENSFHIVFSGEVKCPRRWPGYYTSPDNTIGEQFPQE